MSRPRPISAVPWTRYTQTWNRLHIAIRRIGALAIGPIHDLDVQIASWMLAPHPLSASRARRGIRRRLAAWGLEEFSDVAQLLSSELVTNAIRYAPGPIQLTLWAAEGVVRCEVADSNHSLPWIHDADEGDEEGRGLRLVETMACCWGSSHTATGKVVWFELPAHAPSRS